MNFGVVYGQGEQGLSKWWAQKLIVEYEGEYHFDELQIVRDDARYERFIAAGWPRM